MAPDARERLRARIRGKINVFEAKNVHASQRSTASQGSLDRVALGSRILGFNCGDNTKPP